MFKPIIFSLILFCSNFVSAQAEQSTRIQSSPEWVQYMYSENVNVITLRGLFEDFYSNNEFVKNQHTQHFKRILKNHWAELDANGYIQNNVNYPLASQAKSPTSAWEEIGPWDYDHEQAMEFEVQSPGATHVYTVEQSPANPDIVYAGTATAGLWKSIDKGMNWDLMTRDMDINGIYSIALNPNNPDIVFFGERNGKIWKSIDAGLTFSLTGDLSFQSFNYYARDLKFIGANTLLLATNQGLFRSSDSGLNWIQVNNGEHMEIELKPDDSNIIYSIKLTGSKTEFYKSIDNGVTWVLKPNGWPTPAAGDEQKRCEMSVTAADPNVVYFLNAGSVGVDGGLYGIYKSTDAGESFTFECCEGSPGGLATITNPNILGWSEDGTGEGGQFYYDLALAVSPTDVNKMFGAGINIWRSEDAGVSWSLNGHWVTWVQNLKHRYSHADVHDIKFFDNGTSIDMWIASDGGLYYSSNQGDSIQPRMHGIHGTDFWGFGAGFKDGYVMVGGTYHNGTLIRYNDIYKGGITNPNEGGWLAELGGDNYRGFVNYGDNSIGYADNGSFNFSPIRTERMTSRSFQGDKKCNTTYVTGEYGNYEFHPNNYNTFYSPVDSKLYKTDNGGVSFYEVHDFLGDKIIQVKVAWSNPDIIYVTQKFNGSTFNIWRTEDAGVSWTAITPSSGETNGNGNRTKYIEVDNEDPNKLWCILIGTQTGNKVFQSVDGGTSWQNITTTTIENENVISIAHHYGTDDGLYIGTKKRVYYRNSTMVDWALFNNNLPASTANSFLEPYYGEGKIRSATQRGVYECDFYEEGEPVAMLSANTLNLNLASDCLADTIQFVDHSTVRSASATWQWYFDGGSPAMSTLENPKVVYTTPGTYDVKLVVTDAFGIDSVQYLDLITVTSVTPSANIFEDFNGTQFPPSGWKLYDSDGSSWEHDWPEGDDTDKVASYPNYWVDAIGETHLLITPAVDLSNANWYTMSFDYTYNDNGTYEDSLAILYRTGTQTNWQTIWIKGGSQLNVAGTEVWYWYNENASITWASDIIDFSFLIGESCVEFAFDNRSDYGNHIWIDNVNLSGEFVGVDAQTNLNVNIYPNPSTGLFKVQTSSQIEEYVVVDVTGKIIQSVQTNKAKSFSIDLSNETSGIYFVSILSLKANKVVRIIKE